MYLKFYKYICWLLCHFFLHLRDSIHFCCFSFAARFGFNVLKLWPALCLLAIVLTETLTKNMFTYSEPLLDINEKYSSG